MSLSPRPDRLTRYRRPASLGARVWYPVLLSVTGRHDEAVAEAKRAIDIDPLSANAATALVQVLFSARRFDQAEVAAKAALELDPKFARAAAEMAMLHMFRWEAEDIADKDSEVPQIESWAQKAIQLEPNNPSSRYILGLILLKSGDEAGATEAFQQSIAQDVDQAKGASTIGWAYHQYGRDVEAIRYLRQGL